MDPVPPADDSVPLDALYEMLRSEDTGMFDRYRAMFALRNKGNKDLAPLLVREETHCWKALWKSRRHSPSDWGCPVGVR